MLAIASLNSNPLMHIVDIPTQPAFPPVAPVGPPPPSPPASIKLPDDPDAMPVPRAMSSSSHHKTPSVDDRDARQIPRSPPSAFSKSNHHDLLHRASTDTRLSTVSVRTVTSSRAARTTLPDGASEVLVAESSTPVSVSTSAPHASYMRGHASSLSQSQSPDGYLHPPPHRPTRRNTTGGHIRPVRSAPQAGDGYDLDTDIEDDIQLQAEQIRRERKRAKAQKDAEEALTRTTSRRRGSLGREDENKVLVGNLIGEDHVNYVLMYNMLTGIRIAVSFVAIMSSIYSSRCLSRSRGAKQR